MNKDKFFDRDSNHYYFDDMDKVAEYCKANWSEEVDHILRIAEEVCDQIFLFDLKWDMERTYEPVNFDGEINWRYQPDKDPEFIFQFNRHRFFICLGQAYALTGDEKYAKTYVNQICHWIKNEQLDQRNSTNTTWRTIEAGIRGEYWSKALRYFEHSPSLTEEAVDLIYHSMLEHADYLAKCNSPYHLISNWGVLENHGLFEIAVTLPQSRQTKEWARLALSRLEKEIRVQVMRDGVQWEQSPMYHNEVLHCYQDVILLATRNHLEVPSIIMDKVKAMTYADVSWIKPNHCQIMQGDSDDTDLRDFISTSAYLFKDPILKYAGFEKLDFESVWDLGIQAATEYEQLASKEPDFTSCALADSGNYYLRSNWSEAANLLHFHCGTLGAGHGHSDKLHVDLVAYGEDILVDAGRYNYVTGVERFAFKDPEAHNTITVDHQKFTVCKDSWECSKLSQPVKQAFYSTKDYEFVQGGHLGYMDMANAVFVNRKVIHIKPNIYILADELYTGGEHNYQQYFHFNEKGFLKLRSNGVRYEGDLAAADFYFLTTELTTKEYASKISRHYNHFEENPAIVNEFMGNGFTSAITVIITEHKDKLKNLDQVKVTKVPVKATLKNKIFTDSQAEAVKVEIQNNSYVIILCHQEINSPTDLVEAEGCMGFGNIIVFEPEKEKEIGTVLHW